MTNDHWLLILEINRAILGQLQRLTHQTELVTEKINREIRSLKKEDAPAPVAPAFAVLRAARDLIKELHEDYHTQLGNSESERHNLWEAFEKANPVILQIDAALSTHSLHTVMECAWKSNPATWHCGDEVDLKTPAGEGPGKAELHLHNLIPFVSKLFTPGQLYDLLVIPVKKEEAHDHQD